MEDLRVTAHFTDGMETVMTDVVAADFLEDGGPPIQLVNSGDFLSTPPQTEPFPPPATHSSRRDFLELWVTKPTRTPACALPPLSSPQATDLEWVNSITGGLTSPKLTHLGHPSSEGTDPPVSSESGPSAVHFSSCKGFISARLEPDDYCGFEQSFSTKEHTKKHLNTSEGAVRDRETRPRLKRKSLKNKGKIGNLALGEYVELIQVTLVASQKIVGRVNDRVFAVKTI
jgi:hypothetical protein